MLYPFQSTRDHALRKLILEPGHPQIVLDQQIVAVGSIETEPGSGLYEGLVARIDADGLPHEGFGTQGSGYRIDNTGHDLAFNDMVREPNGNLLVAGTIRGNSNPATTMDYYVTRFRPDGSTDVDGFNPPSDFSLVDLGGSNDMANAIALRNDRIIVAGISGGQAPGPQFDYQGIRVTPNIYTTIQEIDTFVGAMKELIGATPTEIAAIPKGSGFPGSEA